MGNRTPQCLGWVDSESNLVLSMSTVAFDELCSRARAAVSTGDYAEARSLYTQAISTSPESPDAHYGLATCCFMLHDFDSATAHFKEVTRLDPLRATAFINLGALYNRLGQQDDAIGTLRRALQLDPRRAEGYYNLGIAYRQKGMIDLAIQAYREATRLNPRMADAFLNLGNLLLEAERYQEAIAAYQQALTVRPNFEKAMHGLRSAQQALAARTPPSPARAAAVASHAAEAHDLPAATQAFANIVDRAEAMETLRDICSKQEESCRELVRVIEQELGPAIRDLSRSLVGTPAAGELELHVRAYEKTLDNLRTARKDLDGGSAKFRELGARFAAAAHSADQPVA
jgi:tetratricopeptide (TPR) repeat protein